MTKMCIKCKQELTSNMFYKDKSRKDNLSNRCKQCEKQNYDNNSEYFRRCREQFRLNNPEYNKQWNKKIPPGVYMVKCLVNNKFYIGQSVSPNSRKSDHASIYVIKEKNNNTNLNLQADLVKYGKDKFIFGIIEHCEPEQLLEREKYYINLYQPQYNLST
jgi:hypothetical protein